MKRCDDHVGVWIEGCPGCIKHERDEARAEVDRLRGIMGELGVYLNRRTSDAISDAEIEYPPLTDFAAGWMQARNEIIDRLDRLDIVKLPKEKP